MRRQCRGSRRRRECNAQPSRSTTAVRDRPSQSIQRVVPPPPFWTEIVCGVALPPPCVALNVTVLDDNEIPGGAVAAATVNVTTICFGVLVAPAATIGTDAVYVPARNAPSVAVSRSVAGALDEESDAVSQPDAPLPVRDGADGQPARLPPPPFVIGICCAAGLALPTAAANATAVVPTAMVGGATGAAIVKLTVTACGALMAVGAVMY